MAACIGLSKSTEDDQMNDPHLKLHMTLVLLKCSFNADSERGQAYSKFTFERGMFMTDNLKGFQSVIYFLFDMLNHEKCKEKFKNCWPVLKKQEVVFRKVAVAWIKELKEEYPTMNLDFNPSMFLAPSGDQCVTFLRRLGILVLHEGIKGMSVNLKIDNVNLLTSHKSQYIPLQRDLFLLHSRMIEKEIASSCVTALYCLDEQQEENEQDLDGKQMLLDHTNKCKSVMMDVLDHWNLLPETKERLKDINDTTIIEELERKVDSNLEEFSTCWKSLHQLFVLEKKAHEMVMLVTQWEHKLAYVDAEKLKAEDLTTRDQDGNIPLMVWLKDVNTSLTKLCKKLEEFSTCDMTSTEKSFEEGEKYLEHQYQTIQRLQQDVKKLHTEIETCLKEEAKHKTEKVLDKESDVKGDKELDAYMSFVAETVQDIIYTNIEEVLDKESDVKRGEELDAHMSFVAETVQGIGYTYIEEDKLELPLGCLSSEEFCE